MSSPDPALLARVADAALELVSPGTLLGLGTGRAAEAFLRALGGRVRAGLDVRGVPTSERSAALAREVGVPLLGLEDLAGRPLDVAFDGADEVSPSLDLVKGLGGALLRERVVAFEARRFVVLVTPEKLVERLGERAPLPIEVVPFAVPTARAHLAALGRPALREREGRPFQTDNGNAILDLAVDPVADPRALDARIRAIPGVVDTGFFLGMASLVLVGAPEGVRRFSPGGSV